VADGQGAAGDRVERGAVAGAVVGQKSFDGDAVALIKRDGSTQEPDRRRGLLVAQDLGVGKAGGVVDGDVHEVPARLATDPSCRVGVAAGVVRAATEDPLAGAAVDPAELLDVDVNQLAGRGAFIANRGLQAQPAELAHPQSLADRRDRRQRQIEQLTELRRGEPQLA
jgi:hypothetical protein